MRLLPDAPGLADLLVRTLAAGGVVIMPCDTIYGLIGVAPEAEARIETTTPAAATRAPNGSNSRAPGERVPR